MTKRQRFLLVLSPRVRSEVQVGGYKPFDGKPLLTILRDVSAGVSLQEFRRYDQHAVFNGFLYGKVVLDDALIDELHGLPSSLVDCAIFTGDETSAAAARKTLFHFADGAPAGAKLTVLLCNHQCRVNAGIDSQLARNDDTLFAHLWMDLLGSTFNRVGQVVARRWGG